MLSKLSRYWYGDFLSKINIKPGKPTTFGKLWNSFVVNLPGNPLASAVNFEMFVKPIVYKLQGLDISFRVLKVKLKHNINLKRNRGYCYLRRV